MKRKIVVYLSLLLALQLTAKDPVKDFVNDPLLKNANVSLLIKNIKTGEEISELRSNCSDVPASTIKLITTATALELLGSDFRFETKLQIDTEITADGTLNGNLYIYGGGDPTLGSRYVGNRDFLNLWLSAIKKAGIKKINGSIIADESLFDAEGVNPKWIWEDVGNYYAAAAYGISYLDNSVKVHLNSREVGTTPEVLKTDPELPEMTFDNYLVSSSIKTDSAYFYGLPRSNNRAIYGEIPANDEDFVAKTDLPNPGLLLAKHLQQKLTQNGISVSTPPDFLSVKTGKERKTIYTHTSPLLSEIIKELNHKSNNHYAEHIFRYLALQNSSQATTNKAIQTVRNFWQSKGLPVSQLYLYDGSGLSPVNGVSADFFVELLTYMKTQSKNSEAFYDSLPVAGESGTVSSLLRNTPLQGKVHAKSGTISRVRCYAGYIEWEGNTYAFAVMTNNFNTNQSSTIRSKIGNFILSSMQK